MSWDDIFRYPYLRIKEPEHPLRPFKVNARCFIRKDHKCGKIFGASKSCFVACPSEDDIDPIVELISEKLAKVGIEAIIAVKERAYGQDIFCTKICGKIIESKFCLVILDDFIDDEKNIPNPNIYYEYGAMTTLEKHIIPLQKKDQKLAFNIQSYDTIKYTSKNIAAELDRAIKDAIKITELKGKPEKKYIVAERSILRNFELAGFELKGENWFLDDKIDDTEFKGLLHSDQNFIVLLGKIDEKSEFTTYLEDTNLVIYRIKKEIQARIKVKENFKKQIKQYEIQMKEVKKEGAPISLMKAQLKRNKEKSKDRIRKIEKKIKLMNTIYFGFIVNPELDQKDFIKKAEDLMSTNDIFKFACNSNSEIAFGDTEVILSPAP